VLAPSVRAAIIKARLATLLLPGTETTVLSVMRDGEIRTAFTGTTYEKRDTAGLKPRAIRPPRKSST